MGGTILLVKAVVLLAMLAGYGPAPDRSQGVTEVFDVKPSADTPPGMSGQALTERVVRALQERLDPDGRRFLQVRAIGPSRIEVWIYQPKGKAVRGVGNDLDEIKRVVTAQGRLEFRITVSPAEITADERDAAVQSLKHDGLRGSVMVGGLKCRWFAVD